MNPIEFEKQFKNLGIDHEQVRRAGMSSNEVNQNIESNSNKTVSNDILNNSNNSSTNQQSNEESYNMLKRKIDYFTNSILPKVQENFNQLEEKIEELRSENKSYKRDIVQLNNQIKELQKRVQSVRVVFGDNTISNISQSSSNQSQGSSINSNSQPVQNNNSTPDNVRIDKIFNFSNHKF